MNRQRLVLTTEQLAERWACSTGWLQNQRSEGVGVRYMKLGALVRYPLDAVEEFERVGLVGTRDDPIAGLCLVTARSA